MTQLIKYQHLQLTIHRLQNGGGGRQISQSLVKACWVTSFVSKELPVTKFFCRTLKQSSQLFQYCTYHVWCKNSIYQTNLTCIEMWSQKIHKLQHVSALLECWSKLEIVYLLCSHFSAWKVGLINWKQSSFKLETFTATHVKLIKITNKPTTNVGPDMWLLHQHKVRRHTTFWIRSFWPEKKYQHWNSHTNEFTAYYMIFHILVTEFQNKRIPFCII